MTKSVIVRVVSIVAVAIPIALWSQSLAIKAHHVLASSLNGLDSLDIARHRRFAQHTAFSYHFGKWVLGVAVIVLAADLVGWIFGRVSTDTARR